MSALTALVFAALVLEGDLVTMTDRGVIRDGRLLLEDGLVAGVFASEEELSRAHDVTDLPRVRTGGWVFPGFINLHTHMPFNHQPLWVTQKKFQNRYEWQADGDYVHEVKSPALVLYGPNDYNLRNAQTLYAEVRALIGGTTALTSTAQAGYYSEPGRLVRNLEYEPAVSGRVEAHVAEISDELLREEGARLREELDDGTLRAWVAHLAEGVDERSHEEFERLKRAGLLRPEVVIVHGTGLGAEQLRELGAVGGHLVWAPTSNYLLYGDTADVETAMTAGVTVSLSNDWGPSGTHNLLAELKVAAAAYLSRYGRELAPETLVRMITNYPARAIGWEERAGKLEAGVNGDVVVISKREERDPYEALVHATEQEVELVTVRGDAVFGEPEWMERLKPGDSEVVGAVGRDGTLYEKRLDVTVATGDMTLSQARAALREALRFDRADMLERFLDASGRPMSGEALERYLDENYPGLAPQKLAPLFLSNDVNFFESLDEMAFPFSSSLTREYRPR